MASWLNRWKKCIYLESKINSKGEITKETKRTVYNSSKFYHITNGMFWNNEVKKQCKTQTLIKKNKSEIQEFDKVSEVLRGKQEGIELESKFYRINWNSKFINSVR
jgi:hypothetical protein